MSTLDDRLTAMANAAAARFRAIEALRSQLLATTGSTLIGYLAGFANAVQRTIYAKLFDTVSALDFGVKGDGSDETAAIQAALNCGRSKIKFPGNYNYGATAVAVPVNVKVEGDGFSTNFVPLDNSSNFFTLNGGSSVENIQIDPGTQRTGGTMFKLAGNEVTVHKIRAYRGFRLCDFSGDYSVISLSDIKYGNFDNNGAVEVSLIDIVNGSIRIGNILGDGDSTKQPVAGIRIRSCGSCVLWGEINIIHSGYDLLIDPPAGKVVASIFAGDMYLDTAVKGLVIDTSLGGSVVRCAFAKIEASSHSGGQCVLITAPAGLISGVTIDYLETHLNSAGDGLVMTGLPANLNGVSIGKHKAGALTNGAALSVTASCSGWSIDEVEYGNIDGTGAANKYNVYLTGSGASAPGGLIKTGFIGAATTTNVAGDVSKIEFRKVSGYPTTGLNGVLTPPGVPATGVAITNPFATTCRVHMVTTGSMTAISIAGSATGLTGTQASIMLLPSETITVSYSGVLTWTWFRA